MKQLLTTAFLAAVSATPLSAQTAADFLVALKKADTNIQFDVNSEGQPFHIKWGMDTAWDWDYNVNRGINYYGKGLFETGRVSFQPLDIPTDNGDGTYTLSSRQRKKLDTRINLIKLTGTTEINLNCDHEVLFRDVDSNGSCYDKTDASGNVIPNYEGKNNYVGKPENWLKLIKATAQYCEAKGLKVISVSPFNESDYTGWQQYNGSESNGMKDFLAICKLLKADDYFKDIRVCGGNTLNCDRALPWYNYLKEYLDEGNTHQLAGSFDNYAGFFEQVKADGKIGTADELHNVGEAIVGANYGMENGIWWGFDSKARGQFMHDSNEGVRIGYGENRKTWTNGAVYKNNETGEVHGYLGSSERQANDASFAFISTSRDVFFNGYGPTRMYAYDVPGGTGYQKGQINAERLFDITWGEDVAPGVVDGTYQVYNLYSGKMLTTGERINTATRKTSGTSQQWKVYPSYTDGDISYWFIDNANPNSKSTHLNVLNNNLKANAELICYDAGHGANEQWYVKYVKNGYYYIISRLSNKYLAATSTTSGTNVKLLDEPAANITESNLKKYLWRFQPTDSKADSKAPNAPTALSAKQRVGSIELSWVAPETTSTLDGAASYTILRGETLSGGENNADVIEWNTIGRGDTLTTFIDNTAIAGKLYTYKVIAVDYAGNRSEASNEISARTLDKNALVLQLQFDKSLADNTANQRGLSLYGTTDKYSKTSAFIKSGTSAYSFDGSTYGLLPYSVADLDEMTISTWVYFSTGGNTWQRIFDFGNDETHYMFFTPNNGSEMRLVMRNGGDEEILTNGKKFANSWKHLAITLKPISAEKVQAKIYVEGEEIASTDEFTIRPSDIHPSLCYLGRSQFLSDPMFKGYLDDFRIYNYALSPEEIQGVMTDTEGVSKDINDEYEEVTGISNISADFNPTTSATYDLSGRRVSGNSKGIVIKNNKKYIQK